MRRATAFYRHEKRCPAPVAGVDEVGRGPWAGPVCAAAVILDPKRLPPGLCDSKTLPEPAREAVAAEVWRRAVCVGVGWASVAEIDALNIHHATLLAMARAVDALECRPAHVLVDGVHAPKWELSTETMIGGDAACASIAAASLVAKVARDRVMRALDAAHPGYGWAENKGYGTPAHRAGLAARGLTEHHRSGWRTIAALREQSDLFGVPREDAARAA